MMAKGDLYSLQCLPYLGFPSGAARPVRQRLGLGVLRFRVGMSLEYCQSLLGFLGVLPRVTHAVANGERRAVDPIVDEMIAGRHTQAMHAVSRELDQAFSPMTTPV